jgi:hypothetical protein
MNVFQLNLDRFNLINQVKTMVTSSIKDQNDKKFKKLTEKSTVNEIKLNT